FTSVCKTTRNTSSTSSRSSAKALNAFVKILRTGQPFGKKSTISLTTNLPLRRTTFLKYPSKNLKLCKHFCLTLLKTTTKPLIKR
ncbi:MAG: hypothetical protein ACPG05_03760, partial [Bdellovibrionales bacterium]